MTTRETIARLCNVIRALAAYGVQLFDTIILTAYDISMKYKVRAGQIMPQSTFLR